MIRSNVDAAQGDTRAIDCLLEPSRLQQLDEAACDGRTMLVRYGCLVSFVCCPLWYCMCAAEQLPITCENSR